MWIYSNRSQVPRSPFLVAVLMRLWIKRQSLIAPESVRIIHTQTRNVEPVNGYSVKYYIKNEKAGNTESRLFLDDNFKEFSNILLNGKSRDKNCKRLGSPKHVLIQKRHPS